MNRKLIGEYLKTVAAAIAAVVLIWISASYFLLFADKSVDTDLPQYLIFSFGEYVEIEADQAVVSEEGITRLETHNLWLQILNPDGRVIFEANTAEQIPDQYDSYQLINYTLESDRLAGYTVFAKDMENHPGYGIVIGCSSSLVGKKSYTYIGKGEDAVTKSILILIVAATGIMMIAAYVFSKKVSGPVAAIISEIDEISKDQFVKSHYDKNIYKDVFAQLESLDHKLKMGKKMREEWISNISHDIKTPLSTVKGYAEILNTQDYEFEPSEIEIYTGEILKAEQAIEDLVEELKISQTLSEGKFPLKMEWVNLVSLIEECISEIDIKWKSGLEIDFCFEDEEIVFCDRMLIKRSLLNILHNAIIHNDRNIVLCIRIWKEENVHILIRDNGKGMDENELENIFERYYRGTNSENTKGTGLGLAIAKEAVSAHNGVIKVQSWKGKGTEFEIVL